jgi:Host cell surface-exposed lipoprotein
LKIPHAVKGALSGVAVLALVAAVTGCAATANTDTAAITPKAEKAKAETSSAKTEPKAPKMTTSQKNAVESAKNYLQFQAFSKKGLIQQLSSAAGDGFPKADARYAVNHIDVDWNAQAVKSAREYLDTQSFSRNALIEQLSSSAGEGFTLAQAQHAVSKVYS